MRSAVVGSQAVLIQALGFRFCRAGSWAPDACRSLPPGPPSGAAVRGDPEVGIEVNIESFSGLLAQWLALAEAGGSGGGGAFPQHGR
ncbi:unnamed protein product [Rangifer tarandus platyrhynchus]|uniref:Uncharacterized protein n=3 Tax=Rangifer tarandus platyrhynchus TaxID=3082113 RepID=A0ABN8YQA8_RANTA|nr:unnamed protein product [Rangifer tarandus platyrhynchus]CAI9700943.1 unnamed protein product [Rangifer tarandus platyrhynchus]